MVVESISPLVIGSIITVFEYERGPSNTVNAKVMRQITEQEFIQKSSEEDPYHFNKNKEFYKVSRPLHYYYEVSED